MSNRLACAFRCGVDQPRNLLGRGFLGGWCPQKHGNVTHRGWLDRTQYQLTPATQISFAFIYAALPLGMALSVVHCLLIMRDYILDRRFASDAHFDATASASL